MLKLQCKQVFDSFNLDVDISINDFNILGVFGPSGSGKSSLLHAIAGLNSARSVYINNKNITHLAPDKRALTLQLQSCPLFPHLNVLGNLQFTQKHCKNKSTTLTLERVSALLNLEPLLNRDVSGLSGGEQQRVIFGRTLLSGQSVILLDEPFSALDWHTRFNMLSAVQELNKQHAIKFIIVSHSLKELLFCSDTLLHIVKGKVLAQGNAQQVANAIYASYNQTPLSVLNYSNQQFDENFQVYKLTLNNSNQSLYVAPEHIKKNQKLIVESAQITCSKAKPSATSDCNVLIGVFEHAKLINNQYQLTITVDTQLIYCTASKRQWQQNEVNKGELLYVSINNLETN